MSEATVRVINKEILEMEGEDNLILQTIPAINTINTGLFRAGDKTDVLTFGIAPQNVGRLGIFAAKKNGVERAVIMLLPRSGKPDGILICLTQKFEQSKALRAFKWENPTLPAFVHFALLNHVIYRWGAQMLASQRNLALVYILRAKGENELGPFRSDGKFFLEVIKQIAQLTNNAFSTEKNEAFTFSSGIYDFNTFIAAVSKHLPISAVYSIDPSNSLYAANPGGGRLKQYASGAVGGFLPGFEPLPLERWVNENSYGKLSEAARLNPQDIKAKDYLHNYTMPMYSLYLGLKTG